MDWTIDQDDYLIKHYIEESYSVMAENLGIGKRFRNRINRRCAELGLRRPLGTEFNQALFKEWNKKSAYLLGIMASDGSVSFDSCHNDINIRVKESDKIHIENIADWMDSKKRPTYVQGTKSYCLGLSSKEVCEDLIGKGIIPNKSNVGLKMDIPSQYIREFVTGYMDGDGSVSADRRSKYYLSWSLWASVNSEDFIKSVKRILEEQSGMEITLAYTKKLVGLRLTCSRALEFLDWLYKDSEYYMERKFNVYKQKLIYEATKNI